jgi:hypothetical protein
VRDGVAVGVEPDHGVAAEHPAGGRPRVTLLAGLAVWLAYLRWSPDPDFARAVGPLREGPTAVRLAGAGYVLPLALLALGAALDGSTPAAALAGALMVAGQADARAALILTAGLLRPITLAGPRLPGSPGPERRP